MMSGEPSKQTPSVRRNWRARTKNPLLLWGLGTRPQCRCPPMSADVRFLVAPVVTSRAFPGPSSSSITSSDIFGSPSLPTVDEVVCAFPETRPVPDFSLANPFRVIGPTPL